MPQLNDRGGDLSRKWYVFFSVRNPKTDKMERVQKFKHLHKCKTKAERYREAEKQCAYWREKLQAGWTPFADDENVIYQDQLQYSNIAKIFGRQRAANKTFGFFASKYIEKVSGLDPETVITYRSKLRVFTQWLRMRNLADNDISILQQQQLFEFFDWIINDRGLSRNSVKKYRQLLIKVFELAISEKAIIASPVHSLPACTTEIDHAARPIQKLDMDAFLKIMDANDPQLGLFIRFEYNCFMRPKEIRFMKVKWIDFAAGTIVTPRNILKTKHDRVSVIPATFLHELRTKYKLIDEAKEHYVFGKNRKPGEMHLGKNTMRTRFVKIRKALNMPYEYKLYSWKHSGNVQAEKMDIPMVDRMYQNGHTSIQTTEVYTRNKIGRAGNAFRDFESI